MKNIKTKLKTTHTTRDGITSKISDLSTSHLKNIIDCLVFKAYGGKTVNWAADLDDNKGNFDPYGGSTYFDGVYLLREWSLLSYIIEYNKRDNCFADYSALCKEVGGNGTSQDDRSHEWYDGIAYPFGW